MSKERVVGYIITHNSLCEGAYNGKMYVKESTAKGVYTQYGKPSTLVVVPVYIKG